MMSDAAARKVLLGAYKLRKRPVPSKTELQAVQAIGRFEGRYGSGIRAQDGGIVKNNWGAVHCVTPPTKEGECKPGCRLGRDSGPKGIYAICFREYASPELGAADLVRELYRRPGLETALKSGDALAVATVMKKTGYYEAPLNAYALAIENNARHIAQKLGEPELVRRGKKTRPPEDDGAGVAVVAALALAFLASRVAA